MSLCHPDKCPFLSLGGLPRAQAFASFGPRLSFVMQHCLSWKKAITANHILQRKELRSGSRPKVLGIGSKSNTGSPDPATSGLAPNQTTQQLATTGVLILGADPGHYPLTPCRQSLRWVLWSLSLSLLICKVRHRVKNHCSF